MVFSTLWLVLLTATGLIAISAMDPFIMSHCPSPKYWGVEKSECDIYLVESLPEGLAYPAFSPNLISTAFAWNMLLYNAQESISIASFYWSMLGEDVCNSSSAFQGENIFSTLLEKAKDVNVSIVTSGPEAPNNDLDKLIVAGADVKYLDVAKMLKAGVQHAKLWTVDNRHGYLGSANMDWRSLTQVKELGVMFSHCSALTTDLAKVIGAFTYVAQSGNNFPINWGSEYKTRYNRSNPMHLKLNGISADVYISMSPPPFTPPGREDDLEAILAIINAAERFVYVSVMDFQPIIKSYVGTSNKYWPDLTNVLVKASMENRVEVRILVSHWSHSSPNLRQYMKSLRALNGVNGARIRVRFFVVPLFTAEQKSIPYSRVNHNKYMVTDKTLYIGTSNWSGDYFKFAGGAGLVVDNEGDTVGPNGEKSLRQQLEEVFLRDWNSMFADDL